MVAETHEKLVTSRRCIVESRRLIVESLRSSRAVVIHRDVKAAKRRA